MRRDRNHDSKLLESTTGVFHIYECSSTTTVNVNVVGEIPRHQDPGLVDARELTRYPRNEEFKLHEFSSDVGSYINSSVERIKTIEDIKSGRDGHFDLFEVFRITSSGYDEPRIVWFATK